MGIFDFLQPARDSISNFLIDAGVTTPPNSTIILLITKQWLSSDTSFNVSVAAEPAIFVAKFGIRQEFVPQILHTDVWAWAFAQ